MFSRNLAYHTECLVVDVDYQTAPEKKYPYAMLEGYEVAKYFYENWESYQIDWSRIILSGQSAGANLITGIALLDREKGEFEIAQMTLFSVSLHPFRWNISFLIKHPQSWFWMQEYSC